MFTGLGCGFRLVCSKVSFKKGTKEVFTDDSAFKKKKLILLCCFFSSFSSPPQFFSTLFAPLGFFADKMESFMPSSFWHQLTRIWAQNPADAPTAFALLSPASPSTWCILKDCVNGINTGVRQGWWAPNKKPRSLFFFVVFFCFPWQSQEKMSFAVIGSLFVWIQLNGRCHLLVIALKLTFNFTSAPRFCIHTHFSCF